MTLNVRISGPLCDFIAARVGEEGMYENAAEYVRDLIRRDKAGLEQQAFERLGSPLPHGFASAGADRRPHETEGTPVRRRTVHTES